MAKAKEIGETNSSANALIWATDVLRVRFEEVLALRDNALISANIEGVHEMRVAIRRLRSALRDFSPLIKSGPLKESKKQLKHLADTLGQARDQDVSIAALEKLCENAKNEHIKNDIGKKIEKRRALREETQIKLIKTLDSSALESLREDFSKALDEIVKRNRKAAKLSAREMGREVIFKGLREFADLSDSLYNPFNQEKLHQLRIAAKRLRYAIELFTVCWGEQIAPFAKKVTNMQTFLGELHDCDIWIKNLAERLSKEEKQHTDFWLLSKFTKKRTKNYRAALHLWDKWEKNGFIKKLEEILQQN